MKWPSAFIYALHIEWFENNVNLFWNNNQILWWLTDWTLLPGSIFNFTFDSITIYHLLARYWSYFVIFIYFTIAFYSIELCSTVCASISIYCICCVKHCIFLYFLYQLIRWWFVAVICSFFVFVCFHVCILKRGHFNYEADGFY